MVFLLIGIGLRFMSWGRVFGNIGSLGFVFTTLMSNKGMNFFSRILFGAFALSDCISFVY